MFLIVLHFRYRWTTKMTNSFQNFFRTGRGGYLSINAPKDERKSSLSSISCSRITSDCGPEWDDVNWRAPLYRSGEGIRVLDREECTVCPLKLAVRATSVHFISSPTSLRLFRSFRVYALFDQQTYWTSSSTHAHATLTSLVLM